MKTVVCSQAKYHVLCELPTCFLADYFVQNNNVFIETRNFPKLATKRESTTFHTIMLDFEVLDFEQLE